MHRILLLLLVVSSHSFAGERSGNGGDVITCPDSIELLDSFEARANRLHLNLKQKTMDGVLEEVFPRIENLDSFTAQIIRQHIFQLINDVASYDATGVSNQPTTLFTEHELINIDDSAHFQLPIGCQIEQLIIHNPVSYSLEKPFIINARLWNRLSPEQKALTLLHEGWYIFLRAYGYDNSRLARYLNGVFASSSHSEYSEHMFNQDLRSIHHRPLNVLDQVEH